MEQKIGEKRPYVTRATQLPALAELDRIQAAIRQGINFGVQKLSSEQLLVLARQQSLMSEQRQQQQHSRVSAYLNMDPLDAAILHYTPHLRNHVRDLHEFYPPKSLTTRIRKP